MYTKRRLHDHQKDPRKFGDIQSDNDQRCQNIDRAHCRCQHFRDMGNTLDTSINNDSKHDATDCTDQDLVNGKCFLKHSYQ